MLLSSKEYYKTSVVTHIVMSRLDSNSPFRFMEHWEPINHQWILCYKETNFNLGETINNRLESTFNKVKSLCTKSSSLMQLFSEFFSLLGALCNERNHHYLVSYSRKDIEYAQMDSDQRMFADAITLYAYSFTKTQRDVSTANCTVELVEENQYRVGELVTITFLIQNRTVVNI